MKMTHSHGKSKSQTGMSLVETMVALGLLLVVATGIMPMAMIAVTTTENQGHLAARTTEYSQDKMEQLLALAYGDSTSDTSVFPANPTGGQGLAVNTTSTLAAPTPGYVDYLCIDGTPVGAVGGCTQAQWYFERVWQVGLPAGTTNIKQISVTTTVRYQVGSNKITAPQSTVTARKSLYGAF